MEGQPNEVTKPQTTTVTTEPWDPLALKSHKIKKASHTVQKHLIVLSYDAQKIEHAAFFKQQC